jgi:hypothetical protein
MAPQKRRKTAVSGVWHAPCNTLCNRRDGGQENDFQGVLTMFNMNELKQGLVAAVAALVLSATAVGAAVGPAEAGNGSVFAAHQIDGTARG